MRFAENEKRIVTFFCTFVGDWYLSCWMLKMRMNLFVIHIVNF